MPKKKKLLFALAFMALSAFAPALAANPKFLLLFKMLMGGVPALPVLPSTDSSMLPDFSPTVVVDVNSQDDCPDGL